MNNVSRITLLIRRDPGGALSGNEEENSKDETRVLFTVGEKGLVVTIALRYSAYTILGINIKYRWPPCKCSFGAGYFNSCDNVLLRFVSGFAGRY